MMAPRAFNLALCKALELDPNTVRCITIRACAGEAPTVTVQHWPTNDQRTAALMDLLVTHYELAARRELEPPDEPPDDPPPA